MNFRKLLALCYCLLLLMTISCSSKPQVPQECIDAVKLVQDDLKDPASLRIYGDILVVKFAKESSGTLYSLEYDAKNSYGAYSGKTVAEINMTPEGNLCLTGDHIMDWRSVEEIFAALTSDEKIEEVSNMATFSWISGKDVAQVLGCDYYE